MTINMFKKIEEIHEKMAHFTRDYLYKKRIKRIIFN